MFFNLEATLVTDQFISTEVHITPKTNYGMVIFTQVWYGLWGEERFVKIGCLHIDATCNIL